MTLGFQLAPGSDPNDDPPYVVFYEPRQEGDIFYSEHTTTVTKEGSIQASLSKQPLVGRAIVGITASKKKTEESTQRDLFRLSTDTWRDAGCRQPNVVWW